MSSDDVLRLESLQEVSIRGNLSIEDLVRRQIDRCNQSLANPDPSIFEANVRALLAMLPSKKYKEVIEQSHLYNTTTRTWRYKYWCGVPQGSPEAPITSDGKPPKDDWSNVISPVPVEETETDYERLYEVILQAFESINLTWRVEQKVAEFGKVHEMKVPPVIVRAAAEAVSEVLVSARKELIAAAMKRMDKQELRDYIKKINEISYHDVVAELPYIKQAVPTVITDPGDLDDDEEEEEESAAQGQSG